VRALSENADALLPGQTYRIDRDDTDGDPPSSPPKSRRASTPAAIAGAGRGGGCFPRPARRKRAAGKSLPKEKAADSDRHHEG